MFQNPKKFVCSNRDEGMEIFESATSTTLYELSPTKHHVVNYRRMKSQPFFVLHCLPSFPRVFWPKRALQQYFGEASYSTFCNSKFHYMIDLIFSNCFFKIETYVFAKQHPAKIHFSQNTKDGKHLFDFALPHCPLFKEPKYRTELSLSRL